MGAIFVLRGILIYMYAYDHNPPHIHVRTADGEFTMTIKEKIVDGVAKATNIRLVSEFIDEHTDELLEIWDNAQRGEKIEKIKR